MSAPAFTETSGTPPGESSRTSGKATGAAIPGSVRTFVGTVETQPSVIPSSEVLGDSAEVGDSHEANPELKLPPLKSLFIVISGNALFQLSFFIVVSSASAYAEHLGGSSVFAGLAIGIPMLFSGIALFFINKYHQKGYVRPFNIAYAAMILGNLLHALAFLVDYLYLILIGRIIAGFGFTSYMFIRRYCTDPRIVGVRRRTVLASWVVLGQGFGFSAGPFFGGLLYKIGLSNKVFNGYTSPGWLMVIVWSLFWIFSRFMFEEVSVSNTISPLQVLVTQRDDEDEALSRGFPSHTSRGELTTDAPPPEPASDGFRSLDRRQIGVIVCMCYYAMTCFFILASWETNIPVFSAVALDYSPYQAGNFIALGGVATLPFLVLNIFYARRIQDRATLATGSSLGFTGLIIMLIILTTDKLNFWSFFVCWFLIALGFNLASTCTLSLLSKQLPPSWNGKISMAIQYSNYTGRGVGAVLGGAGVKIGMLNYLAIQITVVALGGIMHMTLWRTLKAKTG